jgi:hypothetical protein
MANGSQHQTRATTKAPLVLKQANAESVSGYFFGAAESGPALLVA